MAHTHTPNLNLYKPSSGDAAASWTAGLNANSDTIDALRIDQLQAGTDITAGNASTTAHGLLPKLPNDSTLFLAGDGTWITAGGSGTTDHAALSNLDYASAGHTGFATSDHLHAGYASTALATTEAAGLIQLSGDMNTYLNGTGAWQTISITGGGDVTAPETYTIGNVPTWGADNGLNDGLSLVTSVGLTGSDNALPTEQAVREAITTAVGSYYPDIRTGKEPANSIDSNTVLDVDDLNKCWTIEATTDPVIVTLPNASTATYGQWLSFTCLNAGSGITIQAPTGVYVGTAESVGYSGGSLASAVPPISMQTITIRVVQVDSGPGAKWAIVAGTGTWTAEEAS